jgi:uncharacterized protein (DUF2062 family)
MCNQPRFYRLITAFFSAITSTHTAIKSKLLSLKKQLIEKEDNHQKLIYSCCVGMYIAISPFIFFHTAMVFLFGWLFALNIPVMFAVSCFVNNPLTMIPIYTLDYVVGRWFFAILSIDGTCYNPAWVAYLSAQCEQRLGIAGLSLWPFIVGGNLLALALAGILYLVIYFFYYSGKKNRS